MKTLKKSLALLLALVMSLGCMSVGAWATDDPVVVTSGNIGSLTAGQTVLIDESQNGLSRESASATLREKNLDLHPNVVGTTVVNFTVCNRFTVTVKFDAGGGTGTMGSIQKTYQGLADGNLSNGGFWFSSEFVGPDGKMFEGWKIQGDETNTVYHNKTETDKIFFHADGEMTLVAVWRDKSESTAYTIFTDDTQALIFFRSFANYANGEKYTVQIGEESVEGTVYSSNGGQNFEKYAATESAVPWYSIRDQVKAVEFKDTIQPVSTAFWFYSFSSCTKFTGLDKLDTSRVTNMDQMFKYCKKLTELDLSTFDTRSVGSMMGLMTSVASDTFTNSFTLKIGPNFKNPSTGIEGFPLNMHTEDGQTFSKGTKIPDGDGTNTVVYYADTFAVNFYSDTAGQSLYKTLPVIKGHKYYKPADPTLDGCTFLGWFNDSALTNAVTFNADGTSSSAVRSGPLNLYAKWDYPFQIGSTGYPTLQEAVNAITDDTATTITFNKSVSGSGVKVPSGKNITFDLNSYSYTIDGATVGSTGTETNGFQLLRDSTITFKDGSLNSTKAKILLQNYSNLTLDNMTVSMDNASYTGAYTVSNNNGTVLIKDSTVNANAVGAFAFDVCRYASYPSVNVTVENSTINGNIEFDAGGGDAKDGANLTINSGSINGQIKPTGSGQAALDKNDGKATISITGGTFSSRPATAYVAANYAAVANSDGTYTVIPATVNKNNNDTYSVTVGEDSQEPTATVTVVETTVTKTTEATDETSVAEIVGATVTAESIKDDEISNVIVSAVNAAGASAEDANTIKLSMLVEDQTSELKSSVTLKPVEETAKANNDVIFEVHPVATVYNSSNEELGSSKVENDQLAADATFEVTIPVPGGISGNKVKVTHYYDDGDVDPNLNRKEVDVQIINGKRYVTVTMTRFSLIGMTGEDGVSPFSVELNVTGTTHSDDKQPNAQTVSGYYAVKTGSTVTANLVLKNNGDSAVTVGASTFWLDLDPKLTFESAALSGDLNGWLLNEEQVATNGKLAFTLGTSNDATAKTIAIGGSLTMATITLTVGEVTEGGSEQLLDIALSAMQLQKNGVQDIGGSWTGTQVAVPQIRRLTQNDTTIVGGGTTTTTATHEFSLLKPYTITVPTTPNGYTFGGWKLSDGANSTWSGYTTEENVGKVYTTLADTTGRDGDATITTYWTPKTYTMKFATQVLDDNGNEVKAFGTANNATINAIADVTYNIEQTKTITNPTAATTGALTGYQFTGWKVTTVDSTGTNWTVNEQMNLPANATSITTTAYKYGNVTLTAVYTPIEYTVTLSEISGVTYTKGNTTVSNTSTFNIRDGVTITATKAGSAFAYWKVSAPADPSNWDTTATYANTAATIGKYGNVTLTPVFTLDATVKISGFAYAGTGNYLMGVMIDTDKVVNGATYKYGEAELYLDGNNVYKTALFGEDATGTVYVTIIAQSELQNTGTETEPVYSQLADATKLGYTAGTTSGNVLLSTGTAGDVNGSGSVTTADYGAANDLFRISDGLTPAFAESNYTGLSVLGRLMADASHSNDSIGTKFGSIDDIVAIIRLVQNPG